MVEGESLVSCGDCRNVLHHHCMTVWAESRKLQGEPVVCPLCLKQWGTGDVGPSPIPASHSSSHPALNNGTSLASSSSQHEIILPFTTTGTLPIEFRPWATVFGEDTINCFLAKTWTSRETALKKLKVIILSKIDGFVDDVTVLQYIASIIEMACRDSVLKVYIAALALLPMLFATKSVHLKTVFVPVTVELLNNCADSNDRKRYAYQG